MVFLVPNTELTGISDGCCAMTLMHSEAIGKGLRPELHACAG